MSALATLRHRTLGVAFIGVIVGLLGLSIAFYLHAFTRSVDVTLVAGCQPPPTAQAPATSFQNAAATAPLASRTPVCTTDTSVQNQSAGHELDVPADVKLRGIQVGTVTKVTLDAHHAVLHLALMPSQVENIPADVSAEIIPKTLFGDKYVDLVLPSHPATARIAAGAVITQSTTSIEAEQVFNDLLPLLDTLQPAQLDLTLTNIATALSGRGDEIGANLTRADTYLAGLNPDLGNIEADITGVEELANNVHAATPDLLATARQSSVTAQTLVAKGDVLADFLTGTRGFADTATAVLTRNESALVQLADVSQPTLALLAEYSPEYPCLLAGLTAQSTGLQAAISPHGGDGQYALHINVVIPPDIERHAYTTADAPKDEAQNPLTTFPAAARALGGPCYGLPTARTTPIQGYLPINGTPTPGTPHSDTGAAAASSSATALARILAAPQLGVAGNEVPDLATLLLEPALAGGTVQVDGAVARGAP